MMTGYMGSTFNGSPTLATSVANAEILTGNPRVYNLTLITDQPCTIKINGSADPIYIRASQTVLIPLCNSLKIVEGSITYNWIAVMA